MQPSYTQCRKSNELLLDIVGFNGYIDRLKTHWGQSASTYQREVVIAYHTTLHLVKYFSNAPIERPNHVKVSLIHEERLFLVTSWDYAYTIISVALSSWIKAENLDRLKNIVTGSSFSCVIWSPVIVLVINDSRMKTSLRILLVENGHTQTRAQYESCLHHIVKLIQSLLSFLDMN